MFSIQYLDEDYRFKHTCSEFIQTLENEKQILAHSSGSTGTPKPIELPFSMVKASAAMTNAFFGLTENAHSLLCLSPETIAGKMMLARAYFGDYKIDIQSPSRALKNLEPYDFVAMVPLQLNTLIKQTHQTNLLPQILVGGGTISEEMEQEIESRGITVYHSFGMTETASHVALRRAGKEGETHYTALKGVNFSTQNGQLCIHAPFLGIDELVTNDCVELIGDKAFKWLGRADFAINSGGVKLHPEELEKIWSKHLHSAFFLGSEQDSIMGEKLVLYIEGQPQAIDEASIKPKFAPYAYPKAIHFIPKFVRSKSGKILRNESILQLKTL